MSVKKCPIKNRTQMKKILPLLILTVIFSSIVQSGIANSTVGNRTVVYQEGFNDFWPPDGWTIEQTGTGATNWDQAVPGHIGNGAMHTYSESNEQPNSWLITPPIVLQANTTFMLSFFEKNNYVPDYYGYSGVLISTGSGAAGSSDFVELYESDSQIGSYTEKVINLSAYAGNTIYIAFVYTGTESHEWFIDEVKVFQTEVIYTTLTMLEPVGNGSVTPQPGSHEYDFTPGNAPVVQLNALPGLGSTFGGWTQGDIANPDSPRNTVTMDQDLTVQATFPPYPEDLTLFWHKHGFQNMGGMSTVNAETNLETIDNFANTSIDEITKLVVYGWADKWDGATVPWIPQNTEPFIVRFYNAPQNALPTAFGDPVSEQNVTAKVFLHGVEQFGTAHRTIYKFELDLINPVALQSGWVSVQINGNQGAEGWFIWIAGQTGQGNGNNSSFRRNRANNTFLVLPHDVHLEIWGTQVQIPVPPACVNPLSPLHEAQNVGYPIGANPVVTLSWSEAPDADGYVIYFGETLPGEGIDLGTIREFTPENLAYNTTYQWKVVPYNQDGPAVDCDVWTFTTMQDPTLVPPFIVEFIPTGPNNIPPLNWDDRKTGKLLENTNLVHSPSTQWLYMSFANNPANGRAAKTFLNASANPNVYRWFISPPINLGNQPHSNFLVFDVAITANNNPAPLQLTNPDIFNVVISTDGGATWSDQNTIFTLSGANGDQVAAGGQTFAIPVADYQGIIKIGFYVQREVASTELDIFIGNIKMHESFELELVSNPENGGTTNGAGIYPVGQTVTVQATPNAGFEFVNWTDSDGNPLSANAAYTFEMPGQNTILTANFQLIDYTFAVVVNPENSGSVTIDPEKDFYNIGDEISLSATPAEDYAFLNWQRGGAIIGTQPTLVFTMPAENVNIVANFVSTIIPKYNLTLSVNPPEAGSVTGDGEYEEGTQVQLTATANSGFIFVNWKDVDDNVMSAQPSFQLSMPAMNLSLVAHFQSTTSVEEVPQNQVNIFPNPARGQFTIQAGELMQRVEISDLSGRIVFLAQPADSQLNVNTQGFNTGVYLVRVFTNKGVIVSKISLEK